MAASIDTSQLSTVHLRPQVPKLHPRTKLNSVVRKGGDASIQQVIVAALRASRTQYGCQHAPGCHRQATNGRPQHVSCALEGLPIHELQTAWGRQPHKHMPTLRLCRWHAPEPTAVVVPCESTIKVKASTDKLGGRLTATGSVTSRPRWKHVQGLS